MNNRLRLARSTERFKRQSVFSRTPGTELNHELRMAILRCFNREELTSLRDEIDEMLKDPTWTQKVL